MLVTFENGLRKRPADVVSRGFDLRGLPRDGLLAVHAFWAEFGLRVILQSPELPGVSLPGLGLLAECRA